MKKMLRAWRIALAIAIVAQASMITLLNPTRARAFENEPASVPAVVINEINWAGSSIDATDQWFELYNPSDAVINLKGWSVEGVSSSSSGVYSIGVDRIVPAGSYAVFAKETTSGMIDKTKFNGEEKPNLFSYSSIQLGDNAGNCRNIVVKDSDDNTVDSVSCNEGDWRAGSQAEFRSMERDADFGGWHDSDGFINLKGVRGTNFASPGYENELQAYVEPVETSTLVTDKVCASYLANDYLGNAEDYTYELAYSTDNSGESLAYLTPVDGCVAASPNLSDRTTYYLFLRINEDDNNVFAAEEGVTVENTNIPLALSVADSYDSTNKVAKANIGWMNSYSGGLDITNNLYYREKNASDWIKVGDVTSPAIVNLPDRSKQYEFAVTSVINGLESDKSESVFDNVPVLTLTQSNMKQNKPGTEDKVVAPAGTVSADYLNSKVAVYSTKPTIIDATTPYYATVKSDGSFETEIGDNLSGTYWARLFDNTTGKVSGLVELTNDIVAPNAPILNKIVSSCVDGSCKTEINWSDDSADVASYKVAYKTDGVETITQSIDSASVVMDLPSGKNYEFQILAYDAAGNESPMSNSFSLALAKGVKTTATLVNGEEVISVEAIAGSNQTVVASTTSAPLSFVSTAKAADSSTPTPTPTPQEVSDSAKKTDWSRIIISAILLLIVAGTFYGLSRSLGGNNSGEVAVPPVVKPKDEDEEEPTTPEKPDAKPAVIAPVVKTTKKPASPFRPGKIKKTAKKKRK